MVCVFVVCVLVLCGYMVYEVGLGIEVFEVMEEIGGDVDLVVFDVVMLEMDGLFLLVELCKIWLDLKIIFVFGYVEDVFEENFLVNEKFFFLLKFFMFK